MTTEARRRYGTQRRLRSADVRLKALQTRLEALHADRSGAAALMYRPPLIPDEWVYFGRAVKRIEQEAAAGCVASIQWLEATAPQRAHIDHLRASPLAPRAPDHKGPWLTPMHAQWMGRPRRRHYLSAQRAGPQPETHSETLHERH